jgi:hypothetical protein
MVYMKKVDNALKNPSAGPGNGWFKIAHAGYQNGRWAVDDLISAGGIQKARIPMCIVNGDYLLRFELLALHSASNRYAIFFSLSNLTSCNTNICNKWPSSILHGMRFCEGVWWYRYQDSFYCVYSRDV